jgi:hypothetical protein
MRAIAVLTAVTFLMTANAAWACPMQSVSAANGQTVGSSSDAPSTPIPPKSQQGGSG